MESSAKRPVRRVAGMFAAVLGAFLIGLVVAVIAALIADRAQTCSTGDCEDSLVALAALIIALAVVPVIMMPILGLLGRFGRVFVGGSTAGVALIGVGTFGAGMGWYVVFYPLGIAVLVVTFVVANRPSGKTPTYRGVIVAVVGLVVVAAAAIPLIVKVNDVRAEQRAITQVVEEPLQPEWGDTWPFSVKASDGELFYMVLEAPNPRGDRIADTELTIRLDTGRGTGCGLFGDLVGGGARGCTEIQPHVWRAVDSDGKAHFWVHSDGQWAHVTSSNFVENKDIQHERDTRAEQVARRLRPRSAWRLGASSADCTFCEWFG